MKRIKTKTIIAFLISGLLTATLIVLLIGLNVRRFWLFFIVPGVSVLLGWAITSLLFRPIYRLIQGTDYLTAVQRRVVAERDARDEIEELSRLFVRIMEELKKYKKTLIDLKTRNTEYRKAGKESKESAEYFRNLFEYSNDAVFIYDFDGNIKNVNKTAMDMMGYSRKELLQRKFNDLLTPDESARSRIAHRTSSKTGSIRFESEFQKKDGSSLDVEVSSSVVDMKSGVMQSIVSNITQRKIMERSLRESEEKFRTFMETASDFMFITDGSGLITYANASMIRDLGFADEELHGLPFHELLEKDSIEQSHRIRQEFIESGENIHDLILETKNRRKIHGEMKAVAVIDENGEFCGMRCIFRPKTGHMMRTMNA